MFGISTFGTLIRNYCQNCTHAEERKMVTEFWRSIKDPDLRMAWAVAIAADALQIGAFPLFVEGGMSPLDSVLDVVVAFTLIRLLGWHWAFLPTLIAEALPGADLFPTWTAAVYFVSRDHLRSTEPIILPPEAAPAGRH